MGVVFGSGSLQPSQHLLPALLFLARHFSPVLFPVTHPRPFCSSSRSQESSFAGARICRQRRAPLGESAPLLPARASATVDTLAPSTPRPSSSPNDHPVPHHRPQTRTASTPSQFPSTPHSPYKNHPRSRTRLDFLSAEPSRLPLCSPLAARPKSNYSCRTTARSTTPCASSARPSRRFPGTKLYVAAALVLDRPTLARPRSHANRFAEFCCACAACATPTRQRQGPALSCSGLHR